MPNARKSKTRLDKEESINPITGQPVSMCKRSVPSKNLQWANGDQIQCKCGAHVMVGTGGQANLESHRKSAAHRKQVNTLSISSFFKPKPKLPTLARPPIFTNHTNSLASGSRDSGLRSCGNSSHFTGDASFSASNSSDENLRQPHFSSVSAAPADICDSPLILRLRSAPK
jgi:hypothetical protein